MELEAIELEGREVKKEDAERRASVIKAQETMDLKREKVEYY